jgi:hypothetical protein
MISISSYFSRINQILGINNSQIEIVKDEIKKTVLFNVDSSDIEIKNNIIFLRAKPIIMNEIYMSKKQILDSVRVRGLTNIIDLR